MRKRGAWSPLWQDRDFLHFWAAQTVSHFGSQVSGLALPLVAILVVRNIFWLIVSPIWSVKTTDDAELLVHDFDEGFVGAGAAG